MSLHPQPRFDKHSTTDQVLEGIDLSGKTILVTGSSGGLGAEAARALATHGASIVLAARDLPKTEGVAERIRAQSDVPVEILELDLTSLDSVRSCAKSYLARHDELHVLINNAGIMACPLGRTAEGWELQFATNHVGHFLLTCLLAPALKAGAPSRIVNLSSGAHLMSPVVFDDLHFESREYDKWAAYAQSKTANILFTVELQRRLGPAGVAANAVHPGVILTELARNLSPEDIANMPRAPRPEGDEGGGGFEFKSIEAGAATEVWAASALELEGQGGFYLEDCQVSAPMGETSTGLGYAPYAFDGEAAKRLWQVSESMVGERFDL